MSSLFDKFKTLLKANIPGRNSPYDEPRADDNVSSADIEARLEEIARRNSQKQSAVTPEQVVESSELEAKEPAGAGSAEDIARANKRVESASKALDSAQAQIDALPTGMSDAVKESAEKATVLIEKARAFIEENSAEASVEDSAETIDLEDNSDDSLSDIKRRLG